MRIISIIKEIVGEGKKLGLEVNEDKMKRMRVGKKITRMKAIDE